MTVARAIAILATAAFIGRILARPFVEDLYWQQWLGDRILATRALPRHIGLEAFTAPGAAYVPQEWFFSLLHAAAIQAHIDILVLLLPAIAAGVALWLIVLRCERSQASAGAQAIVVAGVAVVMMIYMAVRVQILVWPLFSAVLLMTEATAKRRVVVFALTVAWANTHASATIVPFVCALDTLTCVAALRWREALDRAVLFVLAALALVCTPLGFDLPRYAMMLASSPIRHYISEWRVLYTNDIGQLLVIFVFLFGIAWSCRQWMQRPVAAGRAVVFTVLAFSAVRYVPLFCIAVAPLAATGFTEFLAWYRRQYGPGVTLPERLPGRAAIATCIVAALILLAVARYAPSTTPNDPRLGIAAVAHDGREHHLYCDDFAWCSVGLLYPNIGVFLDGRADPFPVHVWDDWSRIRWTDRGWESILASYGVDTIITRPRSRLRAALDNDRNLWQSVQVPGPLVVYEKRSP